MTGERTPERLIAHHHARASAEALVWLLGGGIVGKVEANFLGGPAPTARLLEPSREIAAEKAAFGPARR